MPRQGASPERGAAALEFALIAMIFLTMVVGIFEFSRMWMIQSSLSQAAREGARIMAVQDDKTAALNAITSRADSLGVVVNGSISLDDCAKDEVVRAQATAYVGTMSGLLDFAFPSGGINLLGKAEMRCGG